MAKTKMSWNATRKARATVCRSRNCKSCLLLYLSSYLSSEHS